MGFFHKRMTSFNWSQQAFALDARYNAYRAANNPNFRTMYIRRRCQLLRERAKHNSDSPIRRAYLKQRSQLLAQRYGVVPSEGSVKSRSISVRSGSQVTLEGDIELRKTPGTPIVPTCVADASRALVGDTSISENYSFVGIHHMFNQHSNAISRVSFANDDRTRLAIGSHDGLVTVCHVNTDQSKCALIMTLKGHTQAVTDLCWSISNELLVTCSEDGSIRLWEPHSGECVRTLHDSAPVLCATFQSLNNNFVVAGNQKGHVQVVNISTGIFVKGGCVRTGGAATAICCETSGRLLWVGDEKGYVYSFVIDLNSGKLAKGRKLLICGNATICALNNRAWISREARDPCILISLAANMLCIYRVGNSLDGRLEYRSHFPLKHLHHRVRSNFCPLMSFRQGACVVSGSEDSCVYLFDVEKREGNPCLNKLQGHSKPVLDVCFNHDESFLASGDSQGVVIIWKRSLKGSPPPRSSNSGNIG